MPMPTIVDAVILIFLLLLGTCFVICYGLNSLVVFIFARYSEMRNVTNLYISNLALVHILYMTGLPLLGLSYVIYGSWPMNDFHCKMHFVSSTLYKITGSLFILVMLVDRYYFMRHPTNTPKWRTPFIAIVIAVTLWILSGLSLVPVVPYAYTQYEDVYNTTKISCDVWSDLEETKSINNMYMIYSFILGCAIPMLPTLVTYIMAKLHLRNNELEPVIRDDDGDMNLNDIQEDCIEQVQIAQQQSIDWNEHESSYDEINHLVLALAKMHFICWIPYWIIFMTPIYEPHENYQSGPYVVLMYLAGFINVANTALDPILYAYISSDFRHYFKRVLCCCYKSGDEPAQTNV